MRRQLRLGDVVVKEYRQPSQMQTLILATFEKQGWPARIDDPLPRSKRVDRKARLRDAVKLLNRNQRTRLVRFRR